MLIRYKVMKSKCCFTKFFKLWIWYFTYLCETGLNSQDQSTIVLVLKLVVSLIKAVYLGITLQDNNSHERLHATHFIIRFASTGRSFPLNGPCIRLQWHRWLHYWRDVIVKFVLRSTNSRTNQGHIRYYKTQLVMQMTRFRRVSDQMWSVCPSITKYIRLSWPQNLAESFSASHYTSSHICSFIEHRIKSVVFGRRNSRLSLLGNCNGLISSSFTVTLQESPQRRTKSMWTNV